MSDDVDEITFIAGFFLKDGVLVCFMGRDMQPAFQVLDYLCDGTTGDDLQVLDQGSLIGTVLWYNEFLPSHAVCLDCHGQHAVEPDEGSCGADSSDTGYFLPALDPWPDLLRFNQEAEEHGKIEIGSPLGDVTGAEVYHNLL